MAQKAINFYPGLSNLHVIRAYAGLRPYTSDGLPIVGEVEGLGGFIMAAGHGGDGVSLAPITGKLICDLIVHGEPSIPIEELALSRFNGTMGWGTLLLLRTGDGDVYGIEQFSMSEELEKWYPGRPPKTLRKEVMKNAPGTSGMARGKNTGAETEIGGSDHRCFCRDRTCQTGSGYGNLPGNPQAFAGKGGKILVRRGPREKITNREVVKVAERKQR